MGHTVLTLDGGVLSVHREGAIDEASWRRLVKVGLAWLKAHGCGSVLLPHPQLSPET